MRLGIFLAVVFLGILHRASSVPRGILPPSAYAVGHDLSPQVPKAPADECKNVSSSGSQKCGTKGVTHEKTVIPIEKTIETDIINAPPRKDSVTKMPEMCNPDNCKLPNCWCESTRPPVEDMPQFVMLTFDDAVTQENMKFYQELLGDPKRKNQASGCRIAATFFVSAEYLDYPSVNELYRMGNEIALHSISHYIDPSGNYWNNLNTTGWVAEVVDERLMVVRSTPRFPHETSGVSGVPFSSPGGDAGFRMLHSHFDYDSTLIHKRDGPYDAPVFPYTLNHGFRRPCMVHKCPNDTYPGLWTVPLNYLFRRNDDKYNPCAMADSCLPQPETSKDIFEYLRFNFENFYHTNRAPFPVFLHEARPRQRTEGRLPSLRGLAPRRTEDVHLVTVSEVLDFMRDPKPKESYAQRHCTKEDLPESTCPKWKRCHYPTTLRGGERYMRICGTT
uniref:Putative peritrophic membrane chitin binding protein n=2 Tax=Ixodes ricinus TaxID=34613 RepID=A0A090X8N1_IXORI